MCWCIRGSIAYIHPDFLLLRGSLFILHVDIILTLALHHPCYFLSSLVPSCPDQCSQYSIISSYSLHKRVSCNSEILGGRRKRHTACANYPDGSSGRGTSPQPAFPPWSCSVPGPAGPPGMKRINKAAATAKRIVIISTNPLK